MPTCAAAAPSARTARPPRRRDPARGDQRDIDVDQLQQREQPVAAASRDRRTAAVPAGLGALDHERVGTDRRCPRASSGLVTVTHASPDARDDLRAGQPEGERDDRDRLALEQRELRVPVVVVERGRTDPQALGFKALDVVREDLGLAAGPGTNRFTPNGLSVSARVADPLAQSVRAQVAGGEETQPAGARNGGGEPALRGHPRGAPDIGSPVCATAQVYRC